MTTTQSTSPKTTFEVGRTYSMTSPCDSDCVWFVEILSRTAKFVTVSIDGGDPKRIGARVSIGDHEYASPLGTYSMAPVICSDRPLPLEDDEQLAPVFYLSAGPEQLSLIP